jgi:hypothetical protein
LSACVPVFRVSVARSLNRATMATRPAALFHFLIGYPLDQHKRAVRGSTVIW